MPAWFPIMLICHIVLAISMLLPSLLLPFALTGLGLVLTLGYRIVAQTWLLVALLIYALDLLLAFFIQRPNLRRLIGIRAAWDDEAWRAWALRQRHASYAMVGLVGAIGFLMGTKPALS